MEIVVSSSGSDSITENFLQKILRGNLFEKLSQYGEKGVIALAAATPRESGETASSWSYVILRSPTHYKIVWTNDHMAGNTPVAILIQYGHGTGTGGYVPPHDYINPAMKPILDEIVADGWREVTSK